MEALVTPSEEATFHVEFLQGGFIEKAPKLAHAMPVKPRVVLMLSSIYHVEVPYYEPRTSRRELTKLCQLTEKCILTFLTNTLLCIMGEFGAKHASCSLLWQCAKQEFMNIPAFGLTSKCSRAVNIEFLMPANKFKI
jgi:hypothetical protein